MRQIALLLIALATLPAQAKDEIYRWVDKDGVIHYGARPPAKDAKPAALPELQIYKPSASAAKAQSAAAPPPVAEALELRITAPVADETFRDADGLIPVNALLTPALPAGGGYVFYLDGVSQNPKPWSSSTYVLTGVERGEHTVSVAVVDKTGRELKRSAAVSFHSKPPSAN